MHIIKVMTELYDFFNQNIKPVHKITQIKPINDGWGVRVEVIEEKEYMEAHAKDELIGVYQVEMNSDYQITSFSRISMRQRSDMLEE